MTEAPSFPKRHTNSITDGIGLPAKNIESSWETTYGSEVKAPNFDPSVYAASKVDTVKLQSTHWTTGNEYEPMMTENQRNYVAIPPQPRSSIRTRDQLMATSFRLGDGSPMETRASLGAQKSVGISKAVPKAGMKEQLVGSHMNLKMGGFDNWTTTNKSSFQDPQGKPAIPAQNRLQDGAGAREAIGAGEAEPMQSEMRSHFVPIKLDVSPFDKHERLTRLRQSTFQVGDVTTTTYETTSQAAFKNAGENTVKVDPRLARMQRQALSKSQISIGHGEPMAQRSSYGETFIEHRGFMPPPSIGKTAYISHIPGGNAEDTVLTTCSQDAYRPMKAEIPKPVDNRLRDTHIVIGAEGVKETTSLYHDTFKGQQAAQIRVDPSQARAFHTEHHTRLAGPAMQEALVSTSQATYVPHVGVKPRQSIQFEQIEHVITPADPSLTVTQSSMKADFVEHKNARPNRPVNNALQQSHINIGGGMGDSWKTTQNDYFQFKEFKFD